MEMNNLIERINAFARKAKDVGLTDEEVAERNTLRSEYIRLFKSSLKVQLDSIKIVDEDENEENKPH